MKQVLFILALLFFGISVQAQNYREVKFAQIDSLVNQSHDTLHVLNFWATWCKPCVAELPYFRMAAERYKNQPVQFVFVSLDFQNQVETKLVSFLDADPLPGKSWWLNERKLHTMIDRVEKNWSGAIPFTLLLKGDPGQKSYFEGELTQAKLNQLIEENI